MPYTVDSPDLPSNVQALGADLKAQWIEVFNSVMARCEEEGGEDCEGKAMTQANGVIKKRQEEADIGEAVWTTAFINNLPDSSFAIILPGGEKDEDGKTVPRDLRKLPYKDADGKVDLPHLRNALARLKGTDASDAQKAKARATLNKAADEHLKTRQEESMNFLDVVNAVVKEASDELIGALGNLRGAIEKLELEEAQSGSVIPALEALEQILTPKSEEPETEEKAELEITSEAFAESLSGGVIALVEADEPASTRDPLAIRMRLIKAGPGNPHDNHYYPGEVLRRDAHVFEGVKMYTTPHKESERSEDNEVAKIRSIVEFEEDGSPIADVLIFDPGFAEKTRNRAKSGQLDSLECSILAKGVAKEADVDGHVYNVVESIESAQAVDFVPHAGAGGVAVSVAESADKPGPEPEQLELPESELPKSLLEKERILSVLRETNLPRPSRERLADGEYKTDEALKEAIAKETKYVKSVTGSGQPLGGGATQPAGHQMTEEEYREAEAKWWNETREKHGLPPY
jgi:hypothetical protein